MSETERNDSMNPADIPAADATVSPETIPQVDADPEVNLSVESADVAPTEDAVTDNTASKEADSNETETTYRWSYLSADAFSQKARPSRRGMLTYAIVMTAVFLVSFAMLIAVLWVGRYDPIGTLRPGVDADHDDVSIDGVEQAKHSTVVIEVKTKTGGGTGTGIIMRENGYIATNHHVVADAAEIKVTFYDGTVMPAELVGSSEFDDLAVIKVATTGLIPAVFAHDKDAFVGQTVYAIGTPAGPDFAWTTTKGIISYKDREVKIYDQTDGTLAKKLRLFQTDANVNPGNSGGPLINTAGQVVGVVSMKLSEGYEGIGFAIPSDGAVELLDAIIEGRLDDIQSSVSHKRPMLGIVCVPVEGGAYYVVMGDSIEQITEEELSQYPGSELLHPDVSGILVRGITEGMDAVGKILPGDIITAINGEEITTDDELMDVINDYYAGDTVTLTVYRGAVYTPVDIVLSAKPD